MAVSPRRTLQPVPGPSATLRWSAASEQFLRRDLAPGTRRIYGLTLDRIGEHLGDVQLTELTPGALSAALHAVYPDTSPASWNRHVATVRSFLAFARRHGWLGDTDRDPTSALERRRERNVQDRWLSREDLDRLFSDRKARLRDRCLWILLYETAARADEVLRLNVEDLDLAGRRAAIVGKGGDTEVVHWATRTARLLPKVINGRKHGPLFLAERAPEPGRQPAREDLDPTTGHARLSYRRASEVFKKASGGSGLHQLRHSAITHLAEDEVPLPLLMAKSRHASLRTLQRYARPGVEAVARLTSAHDPARRR